MPLTHRQRVLRRLGLPDSTHLSLNQIATLTGVSRAALQDVFNRGIGAARTNTESVRIKGTFEKNPDLSKYPRSSRLSDEQWAFARVYSFLDRGTTFHTADADIARKYNIK